MRIEKQRLNDKSAMIFTFEAVLDQEQVVEMARVVDAEMERPCTLHSLSICAGRPRLRQVRQSLPKRLLPA